MKKLIIIYNLAFFLIGNILVSNIHDALHHDHNHSENSLTCQECIVIDNSNNYILEFNELKKINNNDNIFVDKHFDNIGIYIEKKYLSRAPPIS